MRKIFISALSVSALTLSLGAQGYQGEPPYKSSVAGTPWLNSGLGNTISEVGQLEMRKVTGLGLKPEEYVLTMTVKGSNFAGWDFVTGIINITTKTFTKNTWVDKINSAGDEFAGSISDDGLLFVGDTPNGPVYSTRTSLTADFTTSAPISGVPATYVDSKYVSGDRFAYINGSDIWIGNLNRTTGAVTGNARVSQNPSYSAGMHSHEPMYDENGKLKSWIQSTRPSGQQSNPSFQRAENDRAGDPVVDYHSDTTWDANPTTLNSSGTAYWASAASGYGDPLEIKMFALSTSFVPASGGTIDNTIYVPFHPTNPYQATMLVGSLGTGGIAIPGVNGLLGLNPIGLVVLPPVTIPGNVGRASYAIKIAGAPKGVTVPVQAVVVDIVPFTVNMTNTAGITIE